MARYYVTTPLYYVNDLPHIGHAYTTLAADIFTRAMRLYGHDVRFLTGTDEHGSKVAQSASARNITPKVFSDEVSAAFRAMWDTLNIRYDDFIRTTEERHESVAQGVFKKLLEKGDIYKGSFEGWYCTPCETFWNEGELKEGKTCPTCSRAVEKLKEESYFFKLSKYEGGLLKLYEENKEFLSPSHRANEILSLVRGGLHELSVSRPASRVAWGIPVPGDSSQTIYVWFEALINYISALGYTPANPAASNELFKKYWAENRIHLVGKEIYRFHTVTWPGMLMALGEKPPSKVFAHGWWTVDGEKMSKSKGNVVNPAKVIEEFPLDAFRYYLFREMSFGSDGDFSLSRLRSKMDGEMANNFGNLQRRLISMIEKYHAGKVSKKAELKYLPQLFKNGAEIEKNYERFEFHRALDFIFLGFVTLNGAIDKSAPWKLFKEGKTEEIEHLMFDCAISLAYLAYLLSPVCPNAAEKILRSLNLDPSAKDFQTYLKGITNLQVTLGEPLFPRSQSAPAA